MPLIVISGYPSSGKSTRALQIKNYLQEKRSKNVIILSENEVITSSNFNKNEVYLDKFIVDNRFGSSCCAFTGKIQENYSAKEKEVRGDLKSKAQRLVDRDTVVIVDAGNYIKGYRYEMYCMIKSCKTTQCTVQCEISESLAWEWNTKREISEGTGNASYSQEVFDALIMRYEAPDSRNRWDSPLILLQADDTLPCDDIYNAIFERKPPPPNQSTQNAPLASTNYLQELDRITQDIVGMILSAQKMGVQGNMKLTGYQGLSVDLGSSVLTPAQLGRVRRQFLIYCKMHSSNDTSKVAPLFVQYLTTALKD